MSLESLKLGITEAGVRESMSHMMESEDVNVHTNNILIQMEKQQPELFGFIIFCELKGGIKDVGLFRLGAGLTFDQIPQHHKGKLLTTDELAVVQKSLAETSRPKDGENVFLNVSGFIDKLKKDSPVFVDWLSDMVERLQTDRERMDFMLGSILVAIPFLMRVEAEGLEKKYG